MTEVAWTATTPAVEAGFGAPSVSVIVRSAGAPALVAALGSIAAQDHPRGEVIVVATAGPGQPAVPQRCGALPVRLIAAAVPLEAPAAANAGLAAASGDWVTFLDDTDVFLPGHFRALLAASAAAPDAGVIHGFARVAMPDGSVQRHGHPFSLAQLHAESFIALSAAVFRRALAEQGCRFDETLGLQHDWDFFLQLAQRAKFRFVPREGFQWNVAAALGGMSTEAYEALSARYGDLLLAKWKSAHETLVDKTTPLLRSAAESAQRGEQFAAEAGCQDVLAMSPNDPWALNLLASIQRATGRMSEARRTQEFAVAVRPSDPAFVFNLALVCRAQGDLALARRCCDQAIALDAGFAPAERLRAELTRLS
jgi:hypothetical protein